jgi:NarL family two-component system response regulator LiaR
MLRSFFSRNRLFFLYGASLAILLFLLKWLEWKLIIVDHAFEIYAGSIALIFMGLGIWLALKLSRPKKETIIQKETVYVEKEIYITAAPGFVLNEKEIGKLGISKRELDVLQLMAEGLSNQEIAERLFVSLNTVKTHSSNILEKLDVKRRTQAVEKAKRLSIIK